MNGCTENKEIKAWWKEAVVYQIYPRSFADSDGDGIGDLKGITERLPYLQKLGIDVIWLSPVYQSPNDDNGYDISDYREIMAEFGTMEDFDAMLERSHSLGIRIVMDLVVNHTSDEHRWFVESRSSKDNPYRDYYIWKEPREGKEPNNWESCFSGSAWQYDEMTGMYYLHCFSKKQPDLNWENPRVREEVFDLMDWWCKKGIDGFRMDVISMISKDQSFPDGPLKDNGVYGDMFPYVANGPRVHEYLKEMNRRVLSRYNLMTVGEAAGVTLEEAAKYACSDGSELGMVFHFEHTDSVQEEGSVIGKWTTRKPRMSEIRKVLNKWQLGLEGRAWNSLYWDNHDQPRAVSRVRQDAGHLPSYDEGDPLYIPGRGDRHDQYLLPVSGGLPGHRGDQRLPPVCIRSEDHRCGHHAALLRRRGQGQRQDPHAVGRFGKRQLYLRRALDPRESQL